MVYKLLQINTVINSGSTGRIAEEIGLLAMQNGWESYIAFGRNDRPSRSHKIKIGNRCDMVWHGLQTRLFDKHGFASQKATEKLITQIEEINPDIIHLHNIHGYYLNIEVLFDYLAKANVPVVWTLHDCWAMTGHCSHFSFVGCEKWKTHCNKCPQKNEYPASAWKDNSYQNFARKREAFTKVKNMIIVPVSHWLEQLVSQSYLQKHPVKTIHNGVNLEVFKPILSEQTREKYNIKKKHILLGVTGLWSDRKGLSDFIQLSNRLENDEVILLVGLSKKQLQNLPENIIGIERTENTEELAALYASAEVFLNLTWEDNFPTTNIEALACGTPVITYNTGGSPEAVSPDTGFVVPQGDLDALRNKINEIKANGKSFYTKKCRERAEKYFNKDDKFQEYVTLYNEILNK